MISAATYRLIEGFFACHQLDTLVLKGFSQTIDACQLFQESSARSRLDTVGSTGSTPLVGRDQEIGLLFERWEQIEGGKLLPAVVLEQIVEKTDGVPLFVEELTKMVLESGLLL